MDIEVSIVILNYFHPEVIDVCLRTLEITDGVPYEVIVVDNGSDVGTVDALKRQYEHGRIDKLLLEPVNHMFVGNNIGVHEAEGNFFLLLNSDVGFKNPHWLSKQLAWINGTMKARPNMWATHPTIPKPGPLDIVSIGYSYDPNILPSKVRPEGWCCLFRREAWVDISPDFPFFWGLEEAIAKSMRERGSRCGVLWNYSSLLIHREQGSTPAPIDPQSLLKGRPQAMADWFNGLEIETLDFSYPGQHNLEHSSYMEWD